MSQHIGTLILLTGLPGSGKTTLARFLEQETGGVALATDDYFYTIEPGAGGNMLRRYRFDPTKLTEAHKWNQQRCETEMMGGVETIIIHNTGSRRWEREPYIALAEQHGYRVHVLYVEPQGLSDEDLAQRNEHGVSHSTIAKMRQRWEH